MIEEIIKLIEYIKGSPFVTGAVIVYIIVMVAGIACTIYEAITFSICERRFMRTLKLKKKHIGK